MAVAYDGKEPYIFISYSHKDTADVLNAVDALNDNGFRVWYDNGIEAGTEWPEYIAERMISCQVVIAFMSRNSQDSHNCRREIHFAIELKKDLLVVYLEDFDLSPGMRLQLSAIQAMYRSKCKDDADFLSRLCNAAIIQKCKAPTEISEPIVAEAVAEEILDTPEAVIIPESVPMHAVEADEATPSAKEAAPKLKIESEPAPKLKIEPQPAPKLETEPEPAPKLTFEPAEPIFANKSTEITTALTKGINAANELFRQNKAFHRFAYLNELSNKQITNAVISIAKGKISSADIFALLDDTIATSGKSGYLVTNDHFYGSSTFMDSFDFALDKLVSVSMPRKDHLCYTLANGCEYEKSMSNDCLYVYTLLDEFLKARGSVGGFDTGCYDSFVTESKTVSIPNANDALIHAIQACNSDSGAKKSFYLKYLDELSQKQLDNAVSAIAKNKIVQSDIVALMDDTVRGNGKSGFIITADHFYSGGTGILSTNFDFELSGLVKVEISNKDHLILTYANGRTIDYFFSIYTNYYYIFFKTYIEDTNR